MTALVGPVDDPRLRFDGAEPDRVAVERWGARWHRTADALAGWPFPEMWACLFDPPDAAMLGEVGVRALTTAAIVRGACGELDIGFARQLLAAMRAAAPPARAEQSAVELDAGTERAALVALLLALKRGAAE